MLSSLSGLLRVNPVNNGHQRSAAACPSTFCPRVCRHCHFELHRQVLPPKLHLMPSWYEPEGFGSPRHDTGLSRSAWRPLLKGVCAKAHYAWLGLKARASDPSLASCGWSGMDVWFPFLDSRWSLLCVVDMRGGSTPQRRQVQAT